MNEGKIWTVVNPSVGVPLFLGGVTAIALIVHFAILSHTTWFSGYWQGGARGMAAAPVTAPAVTAPAAATPTPAATPAP
ncbi:MAG: light-harvesting protein [Gemmatimonadaceae bacterium]|nr:light-harvesting protein [Gemmatimonadaceae bacterium]